jgi:hypothetical protein
MRCNFFLPFEVESAGETDDKWSGDKETAEIAESALFEIVVATGREGRDLSVVG